MAARAVAVLTAAVLALATGCGGSGGDGGSGSKVARGDVKKRAARFADCAKQSPLRVVLPKPPNERTDFLRGERFEFAEVDLEEPPLLFFAAIVDFFPSTSDASRAKDKIAASLFGPPPVRLKNVVVHYTDEPGTPKRRDVEKVVTDCLRA